MAKIGVVLSGCGVFDGSEIHEAVLTLLALARAGAEVVVAAPDVAQAHVVNHLVQDEAAGEKRNVLQESARIARGQIIPLSKLKGEEIDGVIFPGGFGAAKNLCTYAFDGIQDMKINPEVERITLEMVRQAKPIGTMCIAPVLTAKILSESGFGVTVTIGNDAKTAADIEAIEATHKVCAVTEVVVDEHTRVVSTPAYMLAQNIGEAAEGITKLVDKVIEMTGIGAMA